MKCELTKCALNGNGMCISANTKPCKSIPDQFEDLSRIVEPCPECKSECGKRMRYPVSCINYSCEYIKTSFEIDQLIENLGFSNKRAEDLEDKLKVAVDALERELEYHKKYSPNAYAANMYKIAELALNKIR